MGKAIKKALPIVGAVGGAYLGSFVGNPALGATLGASLGGAMAGAPKKVKPILTSRSSSDISAEAAPAQAEYAKLLERSKAAGAATGARAGVLEQMGQAALGKGPSLAEAQMKAAQDRNLAQQLGALQSARGGTSALGQRALLQNMAGSGRDIAQQAAISRLGERADFMNQAGAAEAGLRQDIQGKLDLDLAPKRSMQQYEQYRAAALNQAAQATAAQKQAMSGALIGGAASVLGSYLGKPSAAKGGLITKDGVKRNVVKKACGGKVKGYKEGDMVEKPDFLQALEAKAAAIGEKIKKATGAEGQQYDINEQETFRTPTSEARPKVQKKEDGGAVNGPGTETSDSIPAMLSDGEFVIKASEVKKPGILAHLEAINSGKITKKHLGSLATAIKSKKGG